MEAGFISIFGILAFISLWVVALKGLLSAIRPIVRYLRGVRSPAAGPAFRPYYSETFHQVL
ncbi:MAG: hypothetical protein IID52_01830 [Proteobacteria bacterium]|nr:hypothetical protein [Pseudomonadota bacterium]